MKFNVNEMAFKVDERRWDKANDGKGTNEVRPLLFAPVIQSKSNLSIKFILVNGNTQQR